MEKENMNYVDASPQQIGKIVKLVIFGLIVLFNLRFIWQGLKGLQTNTAESFGTLVGSVAMLSLFYWLLFKLKWKKKI